MKHVASWLLPALGCTLPACRGCDEDSRQASGAAGGGSGGAGVTAAPSASESGARTPRPSGTSLRTLLERARRAEGSAYVAPPEAELVSFESWVRALASAAPSGKLPALSAPRGFSAGSAEQGRLWLLAEETAHKRGAGAVVLRAGAARSFLIEAPHTFFDRGTFDLALAAFETLEARALLINTLPRSAKASSEERAEEASSSRSPQDVAHQTASFFSAAHRALTAVEPRLLALQLHGFRDERAPGIAIVVSSSDTRADARGAARALREVLPPDAVQVYPDDIRDLGGMKNAQAQESRATDSAFLHVEMSASLRGRLKDDRELTARVMRALAAAYEGSRK